VRIARLLPLLLLLLPLAAGAQQSDSPEARFQGTWRVANAGSARQGRDQAIERATEDMSIFIRGIARRRLRDGTPIHSAIRITGSGSSFQAHVGPYHLDFAADGRSHAFTDPFEDNEMQAKQRFRNGKLVQTIRGEDATLTHQLSLSDDGDTLTLKVTIESHHLPGDVVFRVRYRHS
jgi:hypothetical protein